MNILINYANRQLRQGRPYSTSSALVISGIDKVIEYVPADIDDHFYRKNKHILKQSRLGGYALWKPYIIKKALNQMGKDDILFYCDIDVLFIKPIRPLISLFNKLDQDVLPFSVPFQLIEKHWTKRDTFVMMNCDEPKYTDTPQVLSGYHLWKKTPFSIKLADEWLTFCQNKQIIDDAPSKMPNYEGFAENRHDQSIFSLLIKKHEIDIHRDFSQKGNLDKSDFPHSTYPQLAELLNPPKFTLRSFTLRYLIERFRLEEKKIRSWIKKIRSIRTQIANPFSIIRNLLGSKLRK